MVDFVSPLQGGSSTDRGVGDRSDGQYASEGDRVGGDEGIASEVPSHNLGLEDIFGSPFTQDEGTPNEQLVSDSGETPVPDDENLSQEVAMGSDIGDEPIQLEEEGREPRLLARPQKVTKAMIDAHMPTHTPNEETSICLYVAVGAIERHAERHAAY